MSVGFLVKSQVIHDMNRMDERGVISRGEVNQREYQTPRARIQTLQLVGVTDTYEHTSTYEGKTTTRTVVDFEIEVVSGRDKGMRFRQPWITVSLDDRAILRKFWLGVGLPIPGPGSTAMLTDLLRKPFTGRIEISGNGDVSYAKVVPGSIGPIDDDDDDEATPTAPQRNSLPSVSGDTAAAGSSDSDDDDDPFDQMDEPGF